MEVVKTPFFPFLIATDGETACLFATLRTLTDYRLHLPNELYFVTAGPVWE